MERRDWLLLLIGLRVSESNTGSGLDPIRIMKALFLFTMREMKGTKNLYEFVPYSYGPCSFDVYGDLNLLKAEGYVAEEAIQGYSWGKYSATIKGQERIQEILPEANDDHVERLKRVKTEVLSLSFLGLLRRVYEEFPEFASNSIVTFGPRG